MGSHGTLANNFLSSVSISSKNRLNGTPSNFNINLNESIQGSYFLKSVMMPITYYNITSSHSLSLIDNGIARVVAITPGIYNAISVAGALQASLTAVSPQTWTVVFSQLTGLMTFTSSATFTLQSSETNVLPLIGYTVGTYASVVSGVSNKSTSTSVVSMGANLSVNVRISNCSTRIIDTNGYSSNFNMPITQVPGGGIELFQPDYSTNPIVLHFDSPQRSLQISLHDVMGKPLLMLADWEMLLLSSSGR